MARGRKRRTINRKYPKNLYRDRSSFKYRNPITGKFSGLGTDEAKAIETANAANLYFASQHPGIDLILNKTNRISKTSISFSELIDEFYIYKKQMSKSENTLRETNYKLNNYRRDFGDVPIVEADVRFLTEWLEKFDSYESWRKHKILLSELFDFAVGKGYLDANFGNPARVLLKRQKPPKVRKRLKLDEYFDILNNAPAWLQNAMEISLQTTLRLGDVLSLRFDQIQDGYLFVTPSKTKDLPDSINLKIKIGPELAETIKKARNSGIVSPFIIHRRPKSIQAKHRKNKDHWTQVNPNYVSKEFATARDKSGLFEKYKTGEAPTFHEIRALSAHMYKLQGRDKGSVQILMGHHSEVMTEMYQSGHGIEYVETWAQLNIDA